MAKCSANISDKVVTSSGSKVSCTITAEKLTSGDVEVKVPAKDGTIISSVSMEKQGTLPNWLTAPNGTRYLTVSFQLIDDLKGNLHIVAPGGDPTNN
jgi:hypothetical protein